MKAGGSYVLPTREKWYGSADRVQAKHTGRVLMSQEDLLLLSRVYKGQGKYEDALFILENPQTGWSSSIGHRSWEVLLQVVELQGLCGQWERQWHTCQDILQGARPSSVEEKASGSELMFGSRGDDWKIWNALVVAASKLGTTDSESVSPSKLVD